MCLFCFRYFGHRTFLQDSKRSANVTRSAILSPDEDVEWLVWPTVVYPAEVLKLPFVGGELFEGIGVHVGVALRDYAVGSAVDKVDAHIGTHAYVDTDEVFLPHCALFGQVVYHLGITEHVGIVGFAFEEIDNGVAAFHLVEFVGVDLLDAEDVVVEPRLTGAGGVVPDDNGVGEGLVVVVPDDGLVEEVHGGVGGGVEERVAHGLSFTAEDFHMTVGADRLEMTRRVADDKDAVGMKVEGVDGRIGVVLVVVDEADERAVGDEGGVVRLAGFGIAAGADDVVDGVAEDHIADSTAVFNVFVVVERVASDVFFGIVHFGAFHGVGITDVGVVGAVLAIHGGGVGVDMCGAPEVGYLGVGVVGEGVGDKTHVGVDEFD